MDSECTFLLNEHLVSTKVAAGLLVLDFLRREQRLTGTKEGCKEGDCGACMVLVGELDGSGSVVYQPVTSCLMPVAELHGKHLVTVEGLNLEELTPVQSAILEHGGSQCGYCTPGIVVSMTGLLLDPTLPVTDEGMKYALGGNLCRCTGYRSLKNCGTTLAETLAGHLDGNRLKNLIKTGVVPGWFDTAAESLRGIPEPSMASAAAPGKTAQFRIAGGTDMYVQQGEHIPSANIELVQTPKGITLEDGRVRVGAMTTFEEFGRHPELIAMMPRLPHWLELMASWQIRNRATVGGNLVNASPIGDMTSLVYALDADLELVRPATDERRTVPMRSFFLGYKVKDLKPDELVEAIVFDASKPNERINWEKVSKRTYLDIATVNTGARFTVSATKSASKNSFIETAMISIGGVAAVPFHAAKTCAFLEDKPVEPQVVRDALQVLDGEISPISDVRGSAEYKRVLTRQLVLAHFIELFDLDYAACAEVLA